jgi:hypothetical protein
MWIETQEGRETIKEISRDLVMEIAPEELAMFDELADEYFQHPQPGKQVKTNDDPLGFGINETLVAVTPAATGMVSTVLAYLLTSFNDALKDTAKESFKTKMKAVFSAKKKGKSPIAFTIEQLKQINKKAFEQARTFGLSDDQAQHLADALVGRLVLPK